jgi:TolB protein
MLHKLLFLAIMALPLFAWAQREAVRSKLEIYDLRSDQRQVVYQEEAHFEAPNWSRDGRFFIFNQAGRLYRIGVDGQRKRRIDTGFADRCNNDHGLSPDGERLVISHQLPASDTQAGGSCLYVLPTQGGTPQRVTDSTPSYWHGWSPDGQTLAYVAERGGEFDIYTIPVQGGSETRLTRSPGLDDGPDYSSDGRYIYYNSFQSGSMEIWRMEADGSAPTQLTEDGYSNWFPHPSPDGRYLVFLSYLEDQGQQHPAMKQVALRLYDLSSGEIRTLCQFTGGQGSINVPSWSPDGQRFAFVTYE